MSRGRILVVTRTGLISEPLIKKLRAAGYQVESAADSATRQSLADFSPELILLDFSLLNDSSMTLLTGLKQRDNRLLIVVITTADNFAAPDVLQKLKIDGYITDPFNFHSVEQLLEKVFASQRKKVSGKPNRYGYWQSEDIQREGDLRLKSPATPQTEVNEEPDGFSEITLPPEGVALERLEKKLIEEALIRYSGNQTKAARCLGMSRDTIRYRIKKFGLTKRRFSASNKDF